MAPDPETVRVTLVIERRAPCPGPPGSPGGAEAMITREQFAERHAADAGDLARAAG